MQFIKVFSAFMLFAAPLATADAATWNLDMAHSEVGFSVRHMMVSNVKGRFDGATGVLQLDDKDVTKSNVNVEIDTASIDTRNTDRDAHLKNHEFFDVAKFPKMTFKSKSVTKAGAGYKVLGDLTIRGVTKPVTLEVETLSGPVKDPWGNDRMGGLARATINRQDFGLIWNKTLDAGGLAVGDEVTILIEAEFIKQK